MAQAGWDERELVRRCKEGSEAGYAELVRRHRQRLFNLAYRIIGDHAAAEDVVQETFLAAFRSMERFEPRPALAPWLSTICIREAGRAARRHSSAAAASLDNVLAADPTSPIEPIAGAGHGPGADPHTAAESAELGRALAAALAELPFKQRSAVALRFVAGLDYGEAASALDVNLNTYKSLLLRGTRQLRETLGASLELPTAGRPGAMPADGPADRRPRLRDREGVREGAAGALERSVGEGPDGALDRSDSEGDRLSDEPADRGAGDGAQAGGGDEGDAPTAVGPGHQPDVTERDWSTVPPEETGNREEAEPAAITGRRSDRLRATVWDEGRAGN